MKKRNLFFLLCTVAACTLMLSCKKDKNKEEEDPDANLPALTNVIGYWRGTYNPGNTDYAFLVKEEDHKIIVYANSADTANADKAYGTWTFDPTTKKCTFYYIYGQDLSRSYSTTGTLIHRRLEGTWGPQLSPTGGGTYKVRFIQ